MKIFFFRIDGTDIRSEIFPVVKVIIDDAQAADYFPAVQTEIPAVFGFFVQISVHAFQISFFWPIIAPAGAGLNQVFDRQEPCGFFRF